MLSITYDDEYLYYPEQLSLSYLLGYDTYEDFFNYKYFLMSGYVLILDN